MEPSAVKDQSSASGKTASRLQRYPLRSTTKSKEEKPTLIDSSNSSAHKRGKPVPNVSKSVGVLDTSEKKSAKPPRRLSVPSKPSASPAARTIGNITPISETRVKSAGKSGKSEMPVSDVSKSSNRKKFNVISSASYWLSRIKLSESAAKHSVSLGFFKLALEAGCEPIQLMRAELKAYARRNLLELEESWKQLFKSYEISENFEQSNVSDACSQVPGEGNHSSDGAVSSSPSVTDSENTKPKAGHVVAVGDNQIKKPNQETTQTKDSVKKSRRSLNKNVTSSKPASEVKDHSTQKKPHKPIKQDAAKKGKGMKQGKKSTIEEGPPNPPPKEPLQQNKENVMEEMGLA